MSATPARKSSSAASQWLFAGFVFLLVLTLLLLEVPLPWLEFKQGTAAVLWVKPIFPWSMFARSVAVIAMWVLFLFFGTSAAAAKLRDAGDSENAGSQRRNQLLGWALASVAVVFCIGFIGRMSFLHY